MTETISLRRANEKIAKAKSKARPELNVFDDFDEWRILKFHDTLDLTLEPIAKRDSVQRINVDDVSCQEFIDKFESQLKPVVLTHVTDKWPAKERWTLDLLAKNYRNEKFKCGEDDYGYNVTMKMKYFVHYMQNNHDDSPLYIFDGNFGEHPRKGRLLDDYFLPEYFKEDLFKYVGDSRRPPHRWIVIGGPRSGTGIHIDPLGTSAWNALLVGYKWWCLFPTNAPRDLVKVSLMVGGKQSREAATWFSKLYPQTQLPSWPREFAPIEILQRPGETVYVPSVWHKTKRGRPKLSVYWLSRLQKYRPDLVELSKQIDLSRPIGVTSDSSSGSSSSSSSSSSCCSSSSGPSSCCSCSSCQQQSESDDCGDEENNKADKESLAGSPKRKEMKIQDSRGDSRRWAVNSR